MGTGDSLRGFALYPPRPIGIAAGETLRDGALYPPLPIGSPASAIICSLPRLGDGVRERAPWASKPGDKLRGELL